MIDINEDEDEEEGTILIENKHERSQFSKLDSFDV